MNETEYVEAVRNKDEATSKVFYAQCLRYYRERCKPRFNMSETDHEEIFIESVYILFNNIEKGKIKTRNGVIINEKGEPFKASLMTYFREIANNKYKEFIRRKSSRKEDLVEDFYSWSASAVGDTAQPYILMDNNNVKLKQLEAVSESLKGMSLRCCEILTKFYYEEKNLDEIMTEVPSFKSKNALKTAKNKCLDNWREAANFLFEHLTNDEI